jgi:photosystem II oxygen-evolving enhancer protein 2
MQKDKDGRTYYTFEFASKASNYIRHALAVVTVGNGELPRCSQLSAAPYHRA